MLSTAEGKSELPVRAAILALAACAAGGVVNIFSGMRRSHKQHRVAARNPNRLHAQMSKKNNQGTRRKQHNFDLQREAANKRKAAEKAAKQDKKLAAKPAVAMKKGKKAKGIRIRKNVVVAVRTPVAGRTLQRVQAYRCIVTRSLVRPACFGRVIQQGPPLYYRASR